MTDETGLADDLFAHDRSVGGELDRLRAGGRRADAATASCLGTEIVGSADDRTISHVVLGVESADATTAIDGAGNAC